MTDLDRQAREKIVSSLECCTKTVWEEDENTMYIGDCENCPLKSAEYKAKGIAACEAWEEKAVALPYSLVRAAIDLLKAEVKT